MDNFINSLSITSAPQMMAQGVWFLPLFIGLMVWSFIWKGWALWRAARDGKNIWFVVLLLVNTVGILEIIYIFAISKKNGMKAIVGDLK